MKSRKIILHSQGFTGTLIRKDTTKMKIRNGKGFIDSQIKSAHSGYRVLNTKVPSSDRGERAGKKGVQNDLKNTIIVKIVHNIFF